MFEVTDANKTASLMEPYIFVERRTTMTIKKNDTTVFEAPNWLVLLGLWSVGDIVVGTVKEIRGTKTDK